MVDLESWRDVPLGEGRILEVLTTGPEAGVPLVFNTGSPGGAASFGPLAAAARSRGFRMVHYSRPGFGRSTADPGRSVADAARDVAAVLDAIGADEFATIGWSGGGPHGLACAAAMPDRCLAVASVSGFAPFGTADLDFFTGMEESNTEEYSRAIAGGAPHALLLEKQAPELAGMQPQPLDEVALRVPRPRTSWRSESSSRRTFAVGSNTARRAGATTISHSCAPGGAIRLSSVALSRYGMERKTWPCPRSTADGARATAQGPAGISTRIFRGTACSSACTSVRSSTSSPISRTYPVADPVSSSTGSRAA